MAEEDRGARPDLARWKELHPDQAAALEEFAGAAEQVRAGFQPYAEVLTGCD